MQYTMKKKKNMRSFSKEDSKINAWEPQEILTRVAYAKGLRGNNLTRKLPHIKCDGTRISGHEKKIDLLKKPFHIPLLFQTRDDKGIKRVVDR